MNPHLESSKSTKVSLQSIYKGTHGLDPHRKSLLVRVPMSNDWASYNRESIQIIDLAYLTAHTGHEFALLRGKHSDILFHGESRSCRFDEKLIQLLTQHKLTLIAHSHPDGDIPVASYDDRIFLKKIKQYSSIIISATTARTRIFTANVFNDSADIM